MFSNVVLVVYCKMSISNAWFSHLWLVKMSILVGESPKISWKITHTAVSQSPVLIKSLASSPHHSFLWFHLTPHGFLKSPPQTYSIGVGPQNWTWSSPFSPPPSCLSQRYWWLHQRQKAGDRGARGSHRGRHGQAGEEGDTPRGGALEGAGPISEDFFHESFGWKKLGVFFAWNRRW